MPCQVDIDAVVNHDVEPFYDYCHLSVLTAGGRIDLWTADGIGTGVVLAETHTYQPGDYVGLLGDEVVVQFRVESDGAWSDEDCGHPSAGAMQVDDVVITLSNGSGAAHDFEDGTLGPFAAVGPIGVGDFAQLMNNLQDLDACVSNTTYQVVFIDDGLVVPGTGGSPCINWCYGPNGYIVNTTGGLAGPDILPAQRGDLAGHGLAGRGHGRGPVHLRALRAGGPELRCAGHLRGMGRALGGHGESRRPGECTLAGP